MDASDQCHPAAGAALVFQYVDERAGDEAHSTVAALAKQVEELSRKLSALAKHNEQLEEALHLMQVGLRRHRSEQINPNQLTMALTAPEQTDDEVSQTESVCDTPAKNVETCDHPEQPRAAVPPEQTETCHQHGDTCSPPPPRKRHSHGRRKVGVVPQLIVQILPPEVLVDGLGAFEQIGHEDSSIIGYRRGGPIELILRRPKFVARKAQSSAAIITEHQAVAQDADDGGRASSAQPPDSESSAAASTDPQIAPTPPKHEASGPVEVLEHEFLAVPVDPTCRHNPFVDGAIVRFFPEQVLNDAPAAKVLIAPPPARPIEKGLADASLLAHLFVDKQSRHLPYYRQEAEFEQFGWPISRGNMARWQYECGQLVRPLVDRMWQQSLARSWFAMDAAGTAIRGSPQYKHGHIFVLVAEGQSVLFRFSPTNNGKVVEALFGDSTATILADASANHNGLFGPGKAREAGCWAHCRRRFVAAFRAAEGAEPAAVLQTMQALFRIEREIAGLEPEQRLVTRARESAPLVEQLLSRAATRRHELPADSLTRKGFVYLDNQKGPLREFLINGEIPISNNLSERELRRHVKGRINWLFHSSPEHADSACAISSLVASAELQGLDPELYLQEILTVLPSYPINRVLELSPENWLATRQRLIAEGRLKYLDLARATGCALSFRPR